MRFPNFSKPIMKTDKAKSKKQQIFYFGVPCKFLTNSCKSEVFDYVRVDASWIDTVSWGEVQLTPDIYHARDNCRSSAFSRVRKCLLTTWKGDSSPVLFQDSKNWLSFLISASLGLGMGLFLLQNISISTNVCSSNTMEEAINSGFSIVYWYAFIKYNMYLPNTSVANLFLIFDDGINSRYSLVSLRCSLN